VIDLEGLKGRSVAEICTEHQISQSLYDPWRDQFLANAAQVFEALQRTRNEAPLAQGNTRLKPLVGELTFELKKRRAAGVTRQPPLRAVQRDEGLLPRIRALKAEHPFGGYHRIWAYLRFVEPLPVNKKRIWRLMRAHHLLVDDHRSFDRCSFIG
jgi:transposase-like protein